MLKFPVGIASFYEIITEDYYYVDRTAHIRTIENIGKTLVFLRPRRFGKSLFLYTLKNYYDVRRADDFERLFGHLAIGKDPTPLHNQYMIMRWDFSPIYTLGNAHDIQNNVYDYLNAEIKDFVRHYASFLPYEVDIHPTNALISFGNVLAAVNATPYKMYLLIDEYDNFANAVLMSNLAGSEQRYYELVQGEGLLKTLFKRIKMALNEEGLDRVFITGVSPMVINDMTSGFNIAKYVSLYPELNDLCGFREEEIVTMMQQMEAMGSITTTQSTESLDMMRTFYNGYSFTYDHKPIMYNPTLTFYFLDHLQRRGEYPENVLDDNMEMDRQKIAFISRLSEQSDVIAHVVNEQKPVAIPGFANRLGVWDIWYGEKDTQFLATLLYYFGALTLAEKRNQWNEIILTIPNQVTRQLYLDRIREQLLPSKKWQTAHRVKFDFFKTGNLGPVCTFMHQYYFGLFDNRDYLTTNELTIKALFMTMLHDTYIYTTESEKTLGRRYGDLVMLLRPEQRPYGLFEFLFEFKYIKLRQLNMSAEEVQALSTEEVQALTPVDDALASAKTALGTYRQTLLDQHMSIPERLRCYAVVAIGYERIVWKEFIT